jgi:hypothetical protein
MQNSKNAPALLLGALIGIAACSDSGQIPTAPAATQASNKTPIVGADANRFDSREHGVRIVRATGDITAGLAEFRALLGGGDPNPNVPGEQPGTRREINWDGVPAARTNVDNFPGNFFNVNSPRGVLFTTDGSGFRISDNGYTDVNPAYAGEFVAFSRPKLFIARGSTITDVQFVVAGSNTQALVTGFGSVFEDVGRAHSTRIEYFDLYGHRILEVAAPRRSDANGISFVGAVFKKAVVARVRIISGDTPLDAGVEDNVKGEGKKRDLVAMDDFIYGEPRAPRSGN